MTKHYRAYCKFVKLGKNGICGNYYYCMCDPNWSLMCTNLYSICYNSKYKFKKGVVCDEDI